MAPRTKLPSSPSHEPAGKKPRLEPLLAGGVGQIDNSAIAVPPLQYAFGEALGADDSSVLEDTFLILVIGQLDPGVALRMEE